MPGRARAATWAPGWREALVVLATVLPYLPTLGWGFIGYDDPYYITHQPYWRDPTLADAADFFTRPIHLNYQPLHLLSYWVDRVVWGPRAVGLRVTQLLLLAGCTAGFLALARRLALPRVAALVGGLAFAWYPPHVENAAWLSQRKDLLFLLLLLLALLTWLGPTSRPLATPDPRPVPHGRRLAALALFVLALLAKTQAVVLVPWLVVLAAARRRLRAEAAWLLVFLAVGLAAAALGLQAQSLYGATATTGRTAPEQALLVLRALAYYAGRALVPYPLDPLPPLPTAWTARELLDLGALALLLSVGAASLLRGRRLLGVLALWFFLALGPVAGVVPVPVFAQDRYLLAPSVALALGLGALAARAGRGGARRRRVVLLLAGGALLGYLAAVLDYAPAWRSARAVWSRALAVHPDHPVAEGRLIEALARGTPADRAEAEARARRLLARHPFVFRAHMVLARGHLARGERAAARERLRDASRSPGVYAYTASVQLGAMALEEGDLEAAAAHAAAAEARAPGVDAECRLLRGRIALAERRLDDAAAELRAAGRTLPEWAAIWRWLAVVERLRGRSAAARTAAARAGPHRRALLAQLALDAGERTAAARLLAGAEPGVERAVAAARLAARTEGPAAARRRLAAAFRREGLALLQRAALEPDLADLSREGGARPR